MLSLKDIESFFPENVKVFGRDILREYIQSKILEILFESKISNKLVFIGGTALRIVYNSGRFSLDLDFDNFDLNKNEFTQVSKTVQEKLEMEGFQVAIKTLTERHTFHYYIRIPEILFQNKLTTHKNEKILIKVDTEPQGFKYKPGRKLLNKFDILTEINVVPLDILLSMKIRAVFTRKRVQGRDFYDIAFLLNRTKPNYDFLKEKLKIDSPKSLKNKLIVKCNELDFDQLAKDIEPLLFNPSDKKKITLFPNLIREVEL